MIVNSRIDQGAIVDGSIVDSPHAPDGSILAVVCHFDEDASIGSVRAIHVTTNLYTLEIPCNGLIFWSSFYLTSL